MTQQPLPHRKSQSRSGPLNQRQALFAAEYAVDYNATQAAVRAGYSPKTASSQAHDLLRKPEIRQYIEAAQEKRAKKAGITADEIVRRLALVFRQDVRKLFDENGAMKPIQSLDDDTAAILESVDATEITSEGVVIGVTKKIKMRDMLKAGELLMRHLGMLNDKLKLAGDAENPLLMLIQSVQGNAIRPAKSLP
jgi:phage terminase small subunit